MGKLLNGVPMGPGGVAPSRDPICRTTKRPFAAPNVTPLDVLNWSPASDRLKPYDQNPRDNP